MKKEICHFWIGHFNNSTDFSEFVGEDEHYYTDEDESKDKFISEFAKSQGEQWIDHDLSECGFEDSDSSFKERFKKYSYSEQWINEVEQKIVKQQIKDVNAVLFITKKAIKNPCSILRNKFTFFYIGEIEYAI